MESEELKKLISQGEGKGLEFKPRLPDAKHLATLISAFANTSGGRLIVGIREDGSIVGLDDVDHARIERAIKAISPSIEIETETVTVDDRSVLVVTVPREIIRLISLLDEHFSVLDI